MEYVLGRQRRLYPPSLPHLSTFYVQFVTFVITGDLTENRFPSFPNFPKKKQLASVCFVFIMALEPIITQRSSSPWVEG